MVGGESMAKMVANKYYTKSGEGKVNSYFITIPKKVAEEANFTEEDNIKVRVEKGKIIIEKE